MPFNSLKCLERISESSCSVVVRNSDLFKYQMLENPNHALLANQAAAMAVFGTLSEAKVHHCLRSGMTLPRMKLVMERLAGGEVGGSRLCSN